MTTTHHADVEAVSVESDECGFELHLTTTDGERHVFNIHAHAIDLLAACERVIAPWHREGMAVLASMRADGAFECNPDESAGAYELSDPKHPRYHSTHADIWDMRERNPDEYEYLRLEAKREKAGEA